jgi:hypothetical protein
MSTSVVKAVNLQVSEVKFSETIKTNKYQGKSVYANYLNKPLRVQLPKMRLPFGVSRFTNPDKPDEVKYSIDVAFDSVDSPLIDRFILIEEKVVEYAEKNSKELFKKQIGKDMLLEFFKSSVRYSEDENGERSTKYPPRLKIKMYTDGNHFSADFYDSEKVNGKYPKITVDEGNIDDIVSKGSSCESIIQCSGIWVVGKSFGISWVLAQMKVYKNENSLNGYAFEDDEVDEELEVQHQEEPLSAFVSDHEEEVEQVSLHQEPSKPVKKQRRKREEL